MSPVIQVRQRGLKDLYGARLTCVWKIRPHALPLSPVSKLPLFLSLPVCRRLSLLMGEEGGGDGRGAKSNDRKKAWPSIHCSIHSEVGPEASFTFLQQSSQIYVKTSEPQYNVFLSHFSFSCLENALGLYCRLLKACYNMRQTGSNSPPRAFSVGNSCESQCAFCKV
jgi:hypothetical protein